MSEDPIQVKFCQFESHFLRQLMGPSRYCIQSMDIVENTRLKEDFEKKKKALREKASQQSQFTPITAPRRR